MRLLIGLPQVRGKLANYAKRYGLVEVAAEAAGKARSWRKQVPPSFAFSLVLPNAVAEGAPDAERALTRAMEAARHLQASVVLLRMVM